MTIIYVLYIYYSPVMPRTLLAPKLCVFASSVGNLDFAN